MGCLLDGWGGESSNKGMPPTGASRGGGGWDGAVHVVAELAGVGAGSPYVDPLPCTRGALRSCVALVHAN